MSMPTPLTATRITVIGLLLAAAVTPLYARQSSSTPRAGGPAPAQPARADATSDSETRIDRLVDRVWIAEASGTVPAGAMYVFLSDNVLVTSATGKPPSLGSWAEDVSGLVITEKGVTAKVDVLELTAERLRIRVHGKTTAEITFAPAIRPPAPPPATVVSGAADTTTPTAAAPAPAVLGVPYRCGADSVRIAFENDKAYVTWADGKTVALPETRSPETTPSRRWYSDGQVRVVEDTSEAFTRVLFARPGFRPRACTLAR